MLSSTLEYLISTIILLGLSFLIAITHMEYIHFKGNLKTILKLGGTGDISKINTINFVNKDGEPVKKNGEYTLNKDWNEFYLENIVNSKTELIFDIDEVPKEPFYVVINGEDSKGNNFRRLSYVSEYRTDKPIFILPPLSIDVGLDSELVVQSNTRPVIFFEVTNNGNQATFVKFYCADDQYILLSLAPWYKWINPQETVTVGVTLITRSGSYKDVITFIAHGPEIVEKKVYISVGVPQTIDQTKPKLNFYFTSDCTEIHFGQCHKGTWTIEVTAQDRESGLLQMTSIPKGIYFPKGFISGTQDQIKGYFSETCCNPEVRLIAVDMQGNREVHYVNAYHAPLGVSAIIAIALGILIFIFIIILIVYLCKTYCLKKQESYKFPTYRGQPSSST